MFSENVLRESMFRESLLENSSATVAQRSCATLMSFGLEMAAIALVVVVPLFINQAVPVFKPLPPPPTTSVTAEEIKHAIALMTGMTGSESDNAIHAPGIIPPTIYIARTPEPAAAPGPIDVCTGCIYDPTGKLGTGIGSTQMTTLLNTTTSFTNPVLRVVPPATKPVYISHIDPGMLISSVEPRYPAMARTTRTQGEVLLAAVIGKDGRVENLKVVRAHPLLVGAALDAVRQWRYRPTILNGQPVEVETTISVVFTLRQD